MVPSHIRIFLTNAYESSECNKFPESLRIVIYYGILRLVYDIIAYHHDQFPIVAV